VDGGILYEADIQVIRRQAAAAWFELESNRNTIAPTETVTMSVLHYLLRHSVVNYDYMCTLPYVLS
jgi:hypothetical protein